MKKVYIDSNVMIRRGKPPCDALFGRVRDLYHAEKISLITTDLTIREIAKHHAKNDYEKIKDIAKPKTRSIYEGVTGAKLPNIDEKEIFRRLFESYSDSVMEMYDDLEAEIISVNDVKPMNVFEQYAHSEGVFSSTNKKNQFPDAFIIEAIKQAATQEEILVISEDKDFEVLASEDRIQHLKSLEQLFGFFGLRSDPPSSGNFSNELENLSRLLEDQLLGHGFIVTDVADTEILGVEINEITIDPLISFSSVAVGGDILLIGDAELSAVLSYEHPDWESATYDAEDTLLVPHHTASGAVERNFRCRFSLSYNLGKDGLAKDITNLNLMSVGHQEIRILDYYYGEEIPF